MTKVQVSEKSTITKPTWEDVQTHNKCVGVIMGLRNGDTIGVTHEQTSSQPHYTVSSEL
jgi:hypothetical protein